MGTYIAYVSIKSIIDIYAQEYVQIFVRPPQTAILLFCISFPLGQHRIRVDNFN